MKYTHLIPTLALASATGSTLFAQDVPSEPRAWDGPRGPLLDDGAVVPPTAPRSFLPVDSAQSAKSDQDLMGLAPTFDAKLFGPKGIHHDLVDGTHWVRGDSYKASAAADGFTFIPFLGSQASQNWPVRFDVSSATVGATALEVSKGASVAREGSRIDLDHGPVDATYRLAQDQVEQTFLIETGGLEGELVLTLDVQTELTSRNADGGLRFSGPDGGVDYGAAFVVLPDGSRTPIQSELDSGALRLTVPAALVAFLGGEVLIDPILSSWSIDDSIENHFDIDAAYDATADAFAFAYEQEFSATDTDVFVTLVDTDGALIDTQSIDFSLADVVDPEVASLNGEDVLLVVATRQFENASDEIVGRIYDVPTLTTTTGLFVIGDTNSNSWSNARPDVGGNSSTAGGQEFCVVWERTFASNDSILPRFVRVDAAGNVGALGALLLPSDPDARCGFVRISESTGNPTAVNVWNICFAYVNAANTERQIRAAQLNADGTVATPTATMLDVGTSELLAELDISDALDLDGLDPTYLISYDNFLAATDEDVSLLVCRNGSLINNIDLNELEHAVTALNQDNTRLSTTSQDFVVSYTERRGGDLVQVVSCVDLVEGSFLAVSERRTDLAPVNPGALSGGAGMASRFSGGLVSSRFVGIGWDYLDTVNNENDLAGVNFFASNGFSPAFQYCDGVVNSTGDRGFLRLSGTRSATSIKTAVASALPPNQFCLLVGATLQANVPMAGGSTGTLCLGGNLGRYNQTITQASAAGVASFTIDPTNIPQGIGTFAAAPGQIYQWQVWHRDVNGGGATSNFTNAVTILFE